MSSIKFNNITFSYEKTDLSIFSDMTLRLPGGVTTLVGQNGTGKSTLLLLAGGRLLPDSGTVVVDDISTTMLKDEESRNRLISFIYQNMEFETDENIASLLQYVFEQGQLSDETIIDEIVRHFDLKDSLGKKFQENSKGDMQKISIAFSLLYGSPYIMMDEPVFALEHRWKEIILEYLNDYAHTNHINLYYSIHELDLSVKYSDNALLFRKDKSIMAGPSAEILSNEGLEEAYQVPMHLLYKRENLYREHLVCPPDTNDLSGQSVRVVD